MGTKKTFLSAIGISVLSVLCFAVIALLVAIDRIARFDSLVTEIVQSRESPWLTQAMILFSLIGSLPVVTVLAIGIMIFLYFVLRHRLEIILFIVIVAGAALLNPLLKLAFQRERPDLYRLAEATGYSFPSGHSMEAFALYAALAFLLWKHIPKRPGRTTVILLSAFMIVTIGISRIYLGVHYPSDVAGGYLAGCIWFSWSIWCFQWYKERRNRRPERK